MHGGISGGSSVIKGDYSVRNHKINLWTLSGSQCLYLSPSYAETDAISD